jgi:transcriptional regulator with XRE-family HTH domain
MPSFQITLTPSRRTAARFVTSVRRAIQKALAEERKKSGLTQSQIARAIGVHRSVINREINGYKDLTLGRVAELAWALGRKPFFALPEATNPIGSNLPLSGGQMIITPASNVVLNQLGTTTPPMLALSAIILGNQSTVVPGTL